MPIGNITYVNASGDTSCSTIFVSEISRRHYEQEAVSLLSANFAEFKKTGFLFYSILFYSILFYSILFYSILFYSILFLFYSISILFYSILFYSIPYY